MRPSLLAPALLVAAFLGASCSSDLSDESRDWSVERLFAEAKEASALKQWAAAIKYFEKLEARFPYGRYAQQAQLEVAYAHWKDQEPALAIAAAERFIKLHPNHENVDYAWYLKGLVNYNEAEGFLSGFSGVDMTERDPKAMQDAFDAFREVVTRFPDSAYAEDSRTRMRWLVSALASYQVHVARWYVKRGAWLAAATRAQVAVRDFPESAAREEALSIMIRSYGELGLNDLREDAERVLRKSFPKSGYLTAGGVRRDVPWWRLWDPDW